MLCLALTLDHKILFATQYINYILAISSTFSLHTKKPGGRIAHTHRYMKLYQESPTLNTMVKFMQPATLVGYSISEVINMYTDELKG